MTTTTKTLSQRFNAAHRSGAPFVAISTPDIYASIAEIITGFNGKAAEKAIYVWDAVRGMTARNEPAVNYAKVASPKAVIAELTRQPIEFLQFAEVLVTRGKVTPELPAIIFASNLNQFMLGFGNDQSAPKVAVTQAVANLRETLKSSGSMLVILSNDITLSNGIVGDFLLYDQPMPNDDAIGEIFDGIVAEMPVEFRTDAVRRDVVNALRGATPFGAETIIATNASRKTGIDTVGVWESQIKAINAVKGLEYFSGGDSFDEIGGCEPVKEFFTLFMTGNDAPLAVVWIDELEKMFGATGDNTGISQDFLGVTLQFMQDNSVPGIILLGHPGTGKSAIAKACGSVTNVPVIKLDMNGMKESLVGASGANLRTALKTLLAISNGKLLFVATSNGIDGMPPELLARFSLPTFFFELPNEAEREAILKIWMRKFNLTEMPTVDLNGFVGRELRQMCENAWRFQKHGHTLDDVARWTVPSFVSSADKIEARCEAANGKYLSASKPGVYRYSAADAPNAAEFDLPSKAGRRRLAD